MGMKRGQLAIFVIAAIIVLMLFMFTFFLRSSVTETRQTAVIKRSLQDSYDLTPVKSYVEACIKDSADDALFNRLSVYGGYLNTSPDPVYNESGVIPQNKTRYHDGVEVPFYVYADVNTSPSLNSIRDRLARFVAVEIENCINDSVFPQFNMTTPRIDYQATGFNFNLTSTLFSVEINADDFSVDVVYPIYLQKDDAASTIDIFSVRIDVPLGDIYLTAQNITKELMVTSNYSLTGVCDTVIPGGCAAGKISSIYIVNRTLALPGNVTIGINTSLIPYRNSFTFWFAVGPENVSGSCTC